MKAGLETDVVKMGKMLEDCPDFRVNENGTVSFARVNAVAGDMWVAFPAEFVAYWGGATSK
jgi:hypothetical protein